MTSIQWTPRVTAICFARLLATLTLAVIAGCAAWIPRPDPNPDDPYGNDPRASPGKYETDSQTDAPSEVAYFLKLDKAASASGAASTTIIQYLNGGFALSDRMCSEWFASLEASRESAEYRQGTAAITGALTATLMGLFKSAPNEIAAAAAVFGGVNSWYNMSKTTFFLTPKLGTVRDKTQALRDAMADDIRSNATITTSYELSRRALVKYQDTCGMLALQRFVDTATDLAKYDYTPAGQLDATTAAKLKTLSAQLLQTIAWPDTTADIDSSVWKQLYVLQFDHALASELGYPKAGIASQLNAAYSDLTDATKKKTADQLLAAIGALLNVQKDVDATRKSVADIHSEADRKLKALSIPGRPEADAAAADEIAADRSAKLENLSERLLNASTSRANLGEVRIISGQ